MTRFRAARWDAGTMVAPQLLEAGRRLADSIREQLQSVPGSARHGWMPRKLPNIVVEGSHDGKTVRVSNTDYAAAIIEYGSKNNPPYAPLRKAALASDLKFREIPK